MKSRLILASSSPRRQYLMKAAGFEFDTGTPDIDEGYPDYLAVHEVARYLSSKKADVFRPTLQGRVVVAADTVVILDGQILDKPKDRDDAIRILSSLSGKTHQVMTGVSIVSEEKEEHFDETTEVTFCDLSRKEIEFYIDHFKPYDKAGSYGAQDTLPEGMNPCSHEEMQFLRHIGKEHIIEQTVTPPPADKRIVVIKEISGSYFNVMGLPVHIVYSHLEGW